MKIDDIKECLRNSWLMEKHWETIVEILVLAKSSPDETMRRLIDKLETI